MGSALSDVNSFLLSCQRLLRLIYRLIRGMIVVCGPRRNRERAPGAATYVVNGGFSAQGTAELSNPADGAKFTAEFNWYSPGMVRFRMKEVDKVRYEVPDVLNTELPSRETKWDAVNAEGPFTRLIKGDINVFVHHEPFEFRMVRSDSVKEKL
eukprot:3345563-Pyramimonas_sp.AAC.2